MKTCNFYFSNGKIRLFRTRALQNPWNFSHSYKRCECRNSHLEQFFWINVILNLLAHIECWVQLVNSVASNSLWKINKHHVASRITITYVTRLHNEIRFVAMQTPFLCGMPAKCDWQYDHDDHVTIISTSSH